MKVRNRDEADVASCVALMRQTHEADGYPQFWPSSPEHFLCSTDETDAWVAEIDGAVVGHVALHEVSGHPILPAVQRATGLAADQLAAVARLLVSPELQGRGIGRALLAAATGAAGKQGRRCALDVVQESTGAIAFYERGGWRRLGPVTIELGSDHWKVRGQAPLLQMWVYLAP